MFGHLLDQFRNNNDQHQDINPWLTAAATYLGSELLQHHGNDDNNEDGDNDHRSHFWRNAALSGALAYGLNKYQEHQHQQQEQEQSYQPQQLANENYYYPSTSYMPYWSYQLPLPYYHQPYYHSPMSYSPYYMNGSTAMTMNPYLRRQLGYPPYSPSFMPPYQYQQTPYSPYYYGDRGIPTPQFIAPHRYSSFSPYHRPYHQMIPYQQPVPYRFMY
ncbi:hypothetical protein BCR42DRAFT_388617 [Absidia repens]|uniref:Uncharacterized protein n=1 Tax=Absidia repens TaxID=90262 RepID=A0A1X2IUD8_9FUNG|nr:hypothetical protein BCR42DRAFT_388617 [Absidia repens]